MSLMDLLAPAKEVFKPGDWIEVENVGEQLTFDEITQMIDQLIVMDMSTESHEWYKVVEELGNVAYERYGNDGMGGERVVNMDDAIEIVKGSGSDLALECKWKLEDEEVNLYVTGCKKYYLVGEGTPEENKYRYCPYCGKKIKEAVV